MKVKVRLFAMLKEIAGWSEKTVEVPDGVSCSDVLSHLQEEVPNLFSLLHLCLVAINGRYVDRNMCVSPGDEMAVLPPVSGG